MAYQRVNKDLSVAGQLQLGELDALGDAGFRSIICNRPDGEATDQPSFGAIEEQARKLCVQARYQPVVPGAIGDERAPFEGRPSPGQARMQA